MKTKYTKNKTQFNIRVNESEYEMIRVLREDYAINLSGAFKLFLADLLKKIGDKDGKFNQSAEI